MVTLVANWKMAPDTAMQALELAKKTAIIARTHKKNLRVIVSVPFPHLYGVSKNAKTLELAAQTVTSTIAPALTGGVSAGMLASYGVTHCIVGHSESRAKNDTNEIVAEQIKRLLEKKISPILCIGEKSRDSQGWYLSVVKDQIETACTDISKSSLKRCIIAYEPVWAIGADALRVATPVECREMIIFIRKIIADIYDEKIARTIPILYGGSVDEENAVSFIKEGESNGLLIGRMSLEPRRFGILAKRIALINP